MKPLPVTLVLLLMCLAWTWPSSAPAGIGELDDPYLWLEDITGEEALRWVRERNSESGRELAESPGFSELRSDLLRILDSKDRIPSINKAGAHFYNFWRDDKNPRGLWRRTTLEEYRKANPKWDVVLNLDALAQVEDENWVWNSALILKPGGCRRALIRLSRGGADAVVVREFDLETRAFVKEGFELPEAKSEVSWIDRNYIYVATDFGPGSMTASGYPRIGKRWRRGTPLQNAETVFEGKRTDVAAGVFYDDTRGFERHFAYRSPSFYETELYLLENGKPRKVDIPRDANAGFHREWMLVELRSPWIVGKSSYAAGSLLAMRFDSFMRGGLQPTVLFEPTPRTSLAGSSWTRRHLILNVLEDVKNTLTVLTPEENRWRHQPLSGTPGLASVSARGVDPDDSDDYLMTTSGYLTPTALLHGTIGRAPEKLKQLPAFFDAADFEVSQHFAVSKDGTRVPYFQVASRRLRLNGRNPTLLYGYGGFEVSLTPEYNPRIGRAWLSQGGVYVVANIRGGSEYGPRWHQAALKKHRGRAYEDFAAVAEDLVARELTSPRHLGALGGSNGGLLMGNMLTHYPQLFGAIVCQAPLLDMKRYTRLPAGASWMAEYGDPDNTEEWEFLQDFSPYHNLKPGKTYPPILFTSSTRDDRVHPGHARKMTARMKEMGFDVRYYENIEGGHGGAADNAQSAHMNALAYTFLWRKLK